MLHLFLSAGSTACCRDGVRISRSRRLDKDRQQIITEGTACFYSQETEYSLKTLRGVFTSLLVDLNRKGRKFHEIHFRTSVPILCALPIDGVPLLPLHAGTTFLMSQILFSCVSFTPKKTASILIPAQAEELTFNMCIYKLEKPEA